MRQSMTHFDFHARAELYLGSDHDTALAQGPRTFRTAAQALHFAFEEAAPVSLRGASLTIGGKTYRSEQLSWLYRSPNYPLPRKRQRKPVSANRVYSLAMGVAA